MIPTLSSGITTTSGVTSGDKVANFVTIMTSSNGNILRVTGHLCGEFTPHKGHWRRALMVFYLILNKRLSKQRWGWWFETPSRPLWRHCNECSLSCWLLGLINYFAWVVPNEKFYVISACKGNTFQSQYEFNSLRPSDAGAKPLPQPMLGYC